MDPWAVKDPSLPKWGDLFMSDTSDASDNDIDIANSPPQENILPSFGKDEVFPGPTKSGIWGQFNVQNSPIIPLPNTPQKGPQGSMYPEPKAHAQLSEALRENMFQASCSRPSLNQTGLWAQNPLMPNAGLPAQKGDMFYDPRRHRNVVTVNRSRTIKQRLAEQKRLEIQRNRIPWVRQESRAVKSALTRRPPMRPLQLNNAAIVNHEDDVLKRQTVGIFREQQNAQLDQVACISGPSLPAVIVSVESEAEVVLAAPNCEIAEVSDWISEETVEEPDLSQQFEALTIDKGRTCTIPNNGGDNPYVQSFHGINAEHGRITTSCFCALPAESMLDTGLFSAQGLENVAAAAGICSASYRNKDGQLVICCRKKGLSLHRVPQLGKMGLFCARHVGLLKKHQVCPLCNEFYEKGDNSFAMCRTSSRTETHLYHLPCRKIMNLQRQCPHCLEDRSLCIEELFTGKLPKYFFHRFVNRAIQGNEKYIDFNKVFTRLKFRSLPIPKKDGAGDVQFFYGYFTKAEKTAVTTAISSFEKRPGVSSRDLTNDIKDLQLPALVSACGSRSSFGNLKDADSNSLLHNAARTAKAAAVVLLCFCGVNVNERNISGETPLMVAVKSGSLAAVFCLQKLGADISAQDNAGRTALHWAAISRSCPLILFLMEKGAEPAIKDKAGFQPMFSVLPWIQEMDFYALICAGSGLHWIDADGWSLLHWIACLQRNDLVKYFFDTELPYLGDKWGETPMHVAVRVGNCKFVELLMTGKTPIIALRQSNEGNFPYELAVKSGETKIKRLMERHMSEALQFFANRIKPFNLASVGQICGDFSRGKNMAPVPCFNFVNTVSDLRELLYSNIVLGSPLYQRKPRPEKGMQITEPCKQKMVSCVDGKCPCTAKQKCKSRQYCSEACRKAGGVHFDSDYVDGCYVEADKVTGRNILYPDSRKPKLTIENRENLKHRLFLKTERCPDLAEDLSYVVDLLDSHNQVVPALLGGKRRSRSLVRQTRRSAGLGARTASAGAVASRNGFQNEEGDVYRWVGVECVLINSEQWEAIMQEKASIVEPGYIPKNEMDLFYELQEFAVDDAILAGAPLWFEKRHLDARWDLSSKYANAPRKHSQSEDPYPQHGLIGAANNLLNKCLTFPEATDACSVLCECSMDCPYRTIRWPSTARMALVYRSKKVGWGVVALARIMRGQFIAEYTGELVQGNLYYNDTYMFDLKSLDISEPGNPDEDGENWVVDARRVGNIGRFFNHSCKPNVIAIEIWEHGIPYQRVCAFSSRTILPGDELTLDYGDGWWNTKQKNEKATCYCGEESCRYASLPLPAKTSAAKPASKQR